MLKTCMSLLVAVVLLFAAVPRTAIARQTSTQVPTVESVKSKIARMVSERKPKPPSD